jgi:hypothetical protein
VPLLLPLLLLLLTSWPTSWLFPGVLDNPSNWMKLRLDSYYVQLQLAQEKIKEL